MAGKTMKKMGFAAALVIGAGLGMAADAQPAKEAIPPKDSIDAHQVTAQAAAGFDFEGALSRLCIEPVGGIDWKASQRNQGPPRTEVIDRTVPPRDTWYAEPVQVFDNLYWVGHKIQSSWVLKTSAGLIVLDTLYHWATEPEIVAGMKKMGLNPADVKYVIITHGHGDHDEGAKYFQDTYGSHIVMAKEDWDLIIKQGTMDGGVPKRDIEAQDGQKITLGDTTVTIVKTPGHTEGTISLLFQVKDKGRPMMAAYSGGTSFNFAWSPANFDIYTASAQKMAKAAAAVNATVIFSNHSEYDQAYAHGRFLATRRPDEENPFIVGAKKVQNYFTVLSECSTVAKMRMQGQKEETPH